MIPMGNLASEAVKKMTEDKKNVNGSKEKAMAGAVLSALKDFCLQDEEFAQAVVQGGSFVDCMKAVAKNVGTSISELEAYKKAVQFYFPGAEIKMQMTIDLVGQAAGDDTPKQTENKNSGMILDLADFFK